MNKARTFVRPLAAGERQALGKGRKSADALTVRRSQILLASAGGMGPAEAGRLIGCTAQAVRNAIRAFEAGGVGCLVAKSHARKDPGRVWDRARDEDLKDLLHRRPRGFGQPTSLWAPALVAEVRHATGWTPRVLSIEAVRQALRRLGVNWHRAKHWITSPDPEYAKKKRSGAGRSAGRRGTRTGWSGSRTRRGGPGWPSRTCSPGRPATRCGRGRAPGTPRAAARRRSPAAGCSGWTPAG